MIRRCSGRCLRSAGLDTANTEVKGAIRTLCGAAGFGDEQTAEALTIASEVVSNWHKHNPAGDLVYSLRATAEEFEQVYTYDSEWFRTVDTLPDAPSLSNMGIAVIRGLCASAQWSSTGGRVQVRLVSVFACLVK